MDRHRPTSPQHIPRYANASHMRRVVKNCRLLQRKAANFQIPISFTFIFLFKLPIPMKVINSRLINTLLLLSDSGCRQTLNHSSSDDGVKVHVFHFTFHEVKRRLKA